MTTGWKVAFGFLGLANLLTIGLPIGVYIWLARQAATGVSGTEIVAVAIGPLSLVGFAVAWVNVGLIGYYLWKFRPATLGRLVGSGVLVLSLAFIMLNLWGLVDAYRDHRAIQADIQQSARDLPQPEFTDITPGKARTLLRQCELKGFYYTGQTEPGNGLDGELSSTGVVLTSVDGSPLRISIADRFIRELVPVARGAQKQCGEGHPQFWHDGSYEQPNQ